MTAVNILRNETPIRVAVIGAGIMGQHHLRIYKKLVGVELIAVVDIDDEKLEIAAKQYDCQSFKKLEDILGKVDAVVIAVPSHLHAAIGKFYLNHGIHCLIEKPLSLTKQDCLELINLAKEKDLILCVGHVEHFNPAIQQLRKILSEHQGSIHGIEVQRMGFNINRATDVDVVMDLMVHDLEIIHSLIGTSIQDLSAFGMAKLNEDWDYVSTILNFVNGPIAKLTASRITHHKVRKLSITTELNYITLDYIGQEIMVYSYKERENADKVGSSGLANGFDFDAVKERITIETAEPLMIEAEHFIESIRTGENIGVSGEQALDALEIAWRIQDQLKSQQIKNQWSQTKANPSNPSNLFKLPSLNSDNGM